MAMAASARRAVKTLPERASVNSTFTSTALPQVHDDPSEPALELEPEAPAEAPTGATGHSDRKSVV